MARAIEFFYGIGSRYSYLASTQMEQLERDTGAAVRWRTLYRRVLMERRGPAPFQRHSTPGAVRCGRLDSRGRMERRALDPFKGTPASGQYETAYRTRDVARWADYY